MGGLGDHSGRLLTFAQNSSDTSKMPSNEHENSFVYQPVWESSQLNLGFLTNLHWLARNHPHALEILAETAADMVEHYKSGS